VHLKRRRDAVKVCCVCTTLFIDYHHHLQYEVTTKLMTIVWVEIGTRVLNYALSS
jgi:hypothetical protein